MKTSRLPLLSLASLLVLFGCDLEGTIGEDSLSDGSGSDRPVPGDEDPTGDPDDEDEASSSSGGETGGSDPGAETGGFDPDPDDEPEGTPCDPVLQDCPDGQHCGFTSEGSILTGFACTADTGSHDIPAGDPCTASVDTEDCEYGSFCGIPDPGSPEALCVAFCDVDTPETCVEGFECTVLNDGLFSACIPEL